MWHQLKKLFACVCAKQNVKCRSFPIPSPISNADRANRLEPNRQTWYNEYFMDSRRFMKHIPCLTITITPDKKTYPHWYFLKPLFYERVQKVSHYPYLQQTPFRVSSVATQTAHAWMTLFRRYQVIKRGWTFITNVIISRLVGIKCYIDMS